MSSDDDLAHGKDHDHSPPIKVVLDRILKSEGIDADGFRMSLWSGFYTNPVFAQIERSFGLLRDANNILFCLAHYGPLTSKSIADVLGRPKNSISRSVEHLLYRDLIESQPVEADRRRILLTIQPLGLEMIEKTTAMFRARQADMLRSLTPVERVALDHILSKLMRHSDDWLQPL